MKKCMLCLLAFLMLFSVSGCAKREEQQGQESTTHAGTTAPVQTASHRLGMGITASGDASKTGSAQIDITVAAVVLDADGKITMCKLDSAQNKVSVTDGALPQDAMNMEFRTKYELGSDYKMATVSSIGKEWYEQADYFAQRVVGLNAEQVKAIRTEKNASGHMVATDDEILTGCTIGVSDFISAIVKACEGNTVTFEGEAASLTIQVHTTVDASSKNASDTTDGSANIYSDITVAALAKDDRELCTSKDSVRPKITFNRSGEITGTQLGTPESGNHTGTDTVSDTNADTKPGSTAEK